MHHLSQLEEVGVTFVKKLASGYACVSRLAPVPAVHLASLVGVWRCVSGRSIFGGFARISSLFVYVGVFGLDHLDLCYFSSMAVAVLWCWSYGGLARRLSDCLLQ